MNIFYLSSSTLTSQKANSVQVMKMCDAFSELGHNVFLFAKKNNKGFNSDSNDIKNYYGIKNDFVIHLIKCSSIRLFGGIESGYKYFKIIKRLKTKPDILYGRNLYALISCLGLNKPIIYESHSAPGIGKKTLEYYLFSKPQFLRLVVINQALFNYYKNNFKIFRTHPEKLCLAPDGAVINYNLINNYTNKTPVIGYAGSLYPGKGIETIIEIAKIMPKYRFIVAGGTQNQIKIFKKTKSDNIYFAGYIAPSKIPTFLSECDILLAPYSNKVYTENYKKKNIVNWMSPLKIFEYMASKKPIVASNLPAIKEILEDNKTALLVG
ncbi:MAG: glycosyltransferase family 4 protein [Candidatus Riflebacteria bacterium]|nr:glycosyltransferase family 4 protein [Candidatus Riflebacteria bacterium]